MFRYMIQGRGVIRELAYRQEDCGWSLTARVAALMMRNDEEEGANLI